MRGSEPMPMRTFSMSAPTRSAMFASSFMKLILVASIAIAGEGLVQRPHQLGGTRVVRADDDPVGLHEVRDGGTLLQELGIGDHVEFDLHAAPAEGALQLRAHLVRGTH